jgi:hypothetical protein
MLVTVCCLGYIWHWLHSRLQVAGCQYIHKSLFLFQGYSQWMRSKPGTSEHQVMMLTTRPTELPLSIKKYKNYQYNQNQSPWRRIQPALETLCNISNTTDLSVRYLYYTYKLSLADLGYTAFYVRILNQANKAAVDLSKQQLNSAIQYGLVKSSISACLLKAHMLIIQNVGLRSWDKHVLNLHVTRSFVNKVNIFSITGRKTSQIQKSRRYPNKVRKISINNADSVLYNSQF